MVNSINEILSGIKQSKFGQKAKELGKRFLGEEEGSLDIDKLKSLKPKLPDKEYIAEAMLTPLRRVKSSLSRLIEKSWDALPDDDWRLKFAKTRGEQTSWDLRQEAKWARKQNYRFPEQTEISHKTADFLDKVADELDAVPDTPDKLNVLSTIRRFFTEEEGSLDIGRLQELFQKKQEGTITPEEIAEAKVLARQAKAESAPPPTPEQAVDTARGLANTARPTGERTWSSTRKRKVKPLVTEQPAAPTEALPVKQPDVQPEAPAQPAAPARPVVARARLPRELQGAAPRFGIGQAQYIPQFADDLDKALYIIAQKNKSASDQKYLEFVMQQTGLDEQSARLIGQGVRAEIKNQVMGKPVGEVKISPIYRKRQKATTKVDPKEAGTGTIAAAANETPKITATSEEAAATAQQAEQAAASLTERLRRATENPNPANAAQEIEDLLDEGVEVLKKIPDAQKPGWIRRILGGNKALLTAWDLSAPGRQGKAFITNKAWWTSIDDMVKAWASPKAAEIIHQSIVEHPSGYFQPGLNKFGKPAKSFAEKVGLDLAGHEEVFATKLGAAAEKWSGVGKSSRAHTAFLNKLRSDQFVSMMDAAKKAGLRPEENLHLAQTYAKFINDATGRGSLNVGKWKLERNLGFMNDVFFAPKNLSGQIRTWNGVLNPVKYWNYDPVMRKQALRSLFAVAGSGLLVGEMARQMGARIVDEPSSSDFRKIRVGDTRIDLFGGYQQFPVAAMKFLMNKETPTSGRDAGRTIDFDKGGAFRNRASVAERFFTNRLSPAGSFVWAWMNNREFDGKPFEVKRALYERTAPIVIKDLWDLAKEDPTLAAVMTPSNVLGLTGTQTYGR